MGTEKWMVYRLEEKKTNLPMHRWHGYIIIYVENPMKPRKTLWLMSKKDPRIQGQHTEINWF